MIFIQRTKSGIILFDLRQDPWYAEYDDRRHHVGVLDYQARAFDQFHGRLVFFTIEIWVLLGYFYFFFIVFSIGVVVKDFLAGMIYIGFRFIIITLNYIL